MLDLQKKAFVSNQSQPSMGFHISPNHSMEENQDGENSKSSIINLISNAPLSNLNQFYDLESSLFKKRIEKLNLKFFWETENLPSQKQIPNPYNKLFLILFKEINLYSDEIIRLNNIIKEKCKNEKLYKNKISEFSQKEKERLLTKQMLKNYQKTNKVLEKKLLDKNKNEEKLRGEITKLKTKHISLNNSQLLTTMPNNINVSTITSPTNHSALYCTTTTNQAKKKVNAKNRMSHSIENQTRFGTNKKEDVHYPKHHKNNSIDKTKYSNKNNIGPQISSFINTSFDSGVILNTAKNEDEFMYPEKDGLNCFTDINDEIINSCMSHFDSEFDLLNGIEEFLIKKKKEIRDTFTKNNFTTLKNTIKKLPA